MQVKCVQSLLNTLVTLTSERDESAYESALIDALSDLIVTVHGTHAEPAIIYSYSLNEEKEQQFSAKSINGSVDHHEIPVALQRAIIRCCNSGEVGAYHAADGTLTKLYPLVNPVSSVTSVIGVEDPQTDDRLDMAINTLLQIYQNFTRLIYDNQSDTLTGLLNRKTFDIKINKILTRMQSVAKRKEDKPDQAYFLAIFDIDHFKRVNDQFGHLIGDEVLLMFAQLMKQSVREADPLFRFGGEEFVGVFECAKSTNINLILERFRQKIEGFSFPQVGKITVSTGYTQIREFDTPNQLIDRADSALYFAKNNGRNRIACFEQLVADGMLQEPRKEGGVEIF